MNNLANDPTWETVGHLVKAAMVCANGTAAVIFIEKDGAVASLVSGTDESTQPLQLIDTLRLFQGRLNDMIKHAEDGSMGLGGAKTKTFIRDSKTGEFSEVE